MARPLRIEYQGAWYHAMNRGLNQHSIFLHDSDYELFITVVKEACKLFNVFVSSYCLLPNRYHLLLCTPEGNLGRFMRHINGVYTQRHNRQHKKDGSLFRGRYKATLVQEEEYLARVVRYIHRNPLIANMVVNLSRYQWSSHKLYESGKSKEDWLDIDAVLGCFSNKRKQAVKIYKNFVEEATDTELEKFYSKQNQSSILGEESFIKNIKERFLYSNKDIAIRYKISTYRTVGTICYRFQEKLKANKKLAKQYIRIKKTCS